MNKVDFASRKFRGLLFSSTLAMTVEYIVLLSDNIIIGHILGEDAIAGMDMVSPFFLITVFLTMLISTGTVICFSKEKGKFNDKKANQYFSQGVIFSLGAGLIMTLIAIFGGNYYLKSMNLSPEVFTYAQNYFNGLVLLPFFQPLASTLYDSIYTDGDEVACNLSSLIQIVVNIGLSVALCFVFGILGVSIATVASTVLCLIPLIFHFFKKNNSLHFVWHFNLKDLLYVFRLSVVDSSMYLSLSIFEG